MNDTEKEKLKKILDSAHINFLIGSGASMNYLATLWNIENLLNESQKEVSSKPDDPQALQVNYSIKSKYFHDCVAGNKIFLSNHSERSNDNEFIKTYDNYDRLIQALKTIIQRRKTTVVNRQINLFTTNMDLFLDDVLESNKISFNDGFEGKMKPVFSTANYKKLVYQSSPHYDNISEIPTFNLFKLHGSVNWRKEEINNETKIVYDSSLSTLNNLLGIEKSPNLIELDKGDTFESISSRSQAEVNTDEFNTFLKFYDDLVFVNPTKEKFQLTTVDYVFYEQLRMYSNSLEKENSVLFVHGFSFAD